MDIREQLEKGKETVALRVTNQCKEFAEFGHIFLDVVYVQKERGKWNDSMSFYDDYYDTKNKYRGLKITCKQDGRNEDPYGWEIIKRGEYCSEGVKLEEAEIMVKTLRKIDKKMRSFNEKEGHAKTFDEYVMRFCRALNVKAFYTREDNNLQYERNDNIGMLRAYLNTEISKNRKKLGFSKAA
ncbi:hypothetical protein A3715_15900 [Oleiphilus sp. HI0009]|nr:hypothetical protein A3715_15900 [Oleiphilus sp. HI0009]